MPSVDERGFRRVLDINTRIELPDETKWSLSDIPRSGKHALIVDGYNSTSVAKHASEHYSQTALDHPITAFSYARAGEHYLSLDTQKDILTSAKLLSMYLPDNDSSQMIPVAISGGGPVTVLGIGEWIYKNRRLPFSRLSSRVPRIILVAPAINPTRILYEEYLRDSHGERKTVPWCVLQLCDKQSQEWTLAQHALGDAFARIRLAGIPIHVIYWPKDILTEFPWDEPIRRVAESLIEAEELSLPDLQLPPPTNRQYKSRGVLMHLKFCSHSTTTAFAIQLSYVAQ